MTTNTDSKTTLVIDVWSDVMCPFCYMGDTLLAKALDAFPHREQVEVRYHSYQLMPHLPSERAVDLNELLVREKGFPRAQAEAMNAQVAARAKEVGLEYRFDKALAVNTRAAHRLSHFAKQHGKQHALMLRLFKAYFTDGLHLGKHEVLADLAVEVGLDRAAALDALASDAFEDDVKADEQQARAIGIQGVPFIVTDVKYAVSGAQSVATFGKALDPAWKAKGARRARDGRSAPAVPGVAQHADLVTNDGGLACEKGAERRAVVLGGAGAAVARDEVLERVVTPGAASDRELARLDPLSCWCP